MVTRTEEKNIIRKVDDLIELLIEISGDSGNLTLYRKQAIEKCCSLIPMLLPFIDGNYDHLEPFIFQLVKERLPNWNIISTFGNLQEELDIIIGKSLKMCFRQEDLEEEFEEKIEEEVNEKEINNDNDSEISIDAGETTPLESQKEIKEEKNNEKELNILQLNLLKLFPQEEMIFNSFWGGTIIDAFLPNKKIVFITKDLSSRIKFISKKRGIKIIVVPENIKRNYRRLRKFIKQVK